MAREDLKKLVYEMVSQGHKRMKPGDLARALAKTPGVDKQEVRDAINELTTEGKLVYSYVGHNWLELPPDKE